MSGAPHTDPSVEQRYRRLRIVLIVIGLLTLSGAIGASFIAFRRDLLLGLTISFAGMLAIGIVFAIYEAIHVAAAIEENTRRANALTPYTMQMTHSLTAVQHAMEELKTTLQVVSYNSQAITEKMHGVTRDMQSLREQLDAVAMYSRTTAVLLHFQQKNGQPVRTNGEHPPTDDIPYRDIAAADLASDGLEQPPADSELLQQDDLP